jgi:hypothetical protein
MMTSRSPRPGPTRPFSLAPTSSRRLTDTLNGAEGLTVRPDERGLRGGRRGRPGGMAAMMADPTGEFAALSYHVV